MPNQQPVTSGSFIDDVVSIATGDPRGLETWQDHAAADDDWVRQHEAEWVRVDQQLRGIAARRAALDAEEAQLLRYAEELKLWRGFGFGSIAEYMERAMGYSPHTAVERLRVSRALAELPLLGDALARGDLAHSAVRELSRVAVPDTEEVWIEAVLGKNLREIEAMVSGHKPGDLPTDKTEPRLHRRTITLEVSPETYDIWRKLHALAAEEHGQRLSDDELIASLFRRAYGDRSHHGAPSHTTSAAASAANAAGAPAVSSESHAGAPATSLESHAGSPAASADAGAPTTSPHAGAPAASTHAGASAASTHAGAPAASTHAGAGGASSPAYKIALKQCPDCKRAWQFSGGRDIEVDPAVLECAACDAVHLGSLDAAVPERATTTVTPRKREQVLARDGHCCTVPGCRRNIGLDLHHIEYQSHGGGHELSNLTALCDLHHHAVHFEKLLVRGTAPDHLTFDFRKPRDRRNVTDDQPTPGRAPPSQP